MSEQPISAIERSLAYAHLVRERLADLRIEQVIFLHHRKGLKAHYQTSWQGRWQAAILGQFRLLPLCWRAN